MKVDSQFPHVVAGFMVPSDDDGEDRSDLLARVVGVEGAQSSEFGRDGERLKVVRVSKSLGETRTKLRVSMSKSGSMKVMRIISRRQKEEGRKKRARRIGHLPSPSPSPSFRSPSSPLGAQDAPTNTDTARGKLLPLIIYTNSPENLHR